MESISSHALRFSVETLVSNAVKTGKRVYLWTFTFADVVDTKTASRRWNAFSTRIKRLYPNLGGVRVYELHPGGHGLHIHLITDDFIDVRKMWDKKVGWEFGRPHVEPCLDLSNPEALAGYLAKYVSKALGSRPPCLKGMRLWACWGNFKGTKVKNVHRTTGLTVFLRRCVAICQWDDEKFYYNFDFDPYFNEIRQIYLQGYALKDFNSKICKDEKKSLRFSFLQKCKNIYKYRLTKEWLDALDVHFGKSPFLKIL